MNEQKAHNLRWLFLSRSGRIARLSFFLASLFLMTLLALIVWQLVRMEGNEELLAWGGLAFIFVGLFSIYSMIALTLKRLNDLSLPWYFVIGLFVPTINYIFLGFLFFLPSKQEINRQGPPPFGLNR